jgi:hypothetical protein
MVLNIAPFGKQVQKKLEIIELWCWRCTKNLVLSNCVRNEEVLHIAKEESNSVHKINIRKFKLIGHNLLGNCVIKHNIARKKRWMVRSERKQKTWAATG